MHNISLPPLNALRAFETAARHLSFTAAAEELNVTQGAISRHVKGLEDHLSLQLFERRHRSLTLTPEGRKLQQGLQGAFEQITESVQSLSQQSRELNIKALPTMAVRWLIPRLHGFEAAHPDAPINLTTAWMCFEPERESYDAGIIYKSEILPDRYSGQSLRMDLIFEEWMTPVCAPGYLDGKPPLENAGDLCRHTVISCKGNHGHDDWQVWSRQMGIKSFTPSGMLNFDFLDIALNAAAAGQGIALGDVRFIQSDLKTGRLITPLQLAPLKVGSYHLISRRLARPHPSLALFREWLLAEGAGTGS